MGLPAQAARAPTLGCGVGCAGGTGLTEINPAEAERQGQLPRPGLAMQA